MNQFENRSSDQQQYALLNLAGHLFASGNYERLHTLIMNERWYRSKLDFDTSGASYVQDIELGIEASAKTELEGLPRIVAYSKLVASLRTLVTSIPIEMFLQLIDSGESDLVENYANLTPDPEQRIELYKLLYVYVSQFDSKRSKANVLQKALESIKLIRHRKQRMRLYSDLAELAKQAGEHRNAREILKSALLQTDRIRDDASYENEARSLLEKFTISLDEVFLNDAFIAAENIEAEEARLKVVTELSRQIYSLSSDRPKLIYFHIVYTFAIIRQQGRDSFLSYLRIIWSILENILNSEQVEELLRVCDFSDSLLGLPATEWRNNVFEYKKTSATSENSKVSILFLASEPTDNPPLRLGEEFREIQERLKLAKLRERFRLELPQLSIRSIDISQALLDIQPQIVHFSGHGTTTGALCFEDQVGQTYLVHPDAVAALFQQFANQIQCVVLNACYSQEQASAIANHINYVIGTDQEIDDKASIAFSAGFYQALGAGRTIEEAYGLGCVQMELQGFPKNLAPILIKKRNVQL